MRETRCFFHGFRVLLSFFNLDFNAIISRLRELVDNLPSEEVLISDVKVFLADLQQRGFLSK